MGVVETRELLVGFNLELVVVSFFSLKYLSIRPFILSGSGSGLAFSFSFFSFFLFSTKTSLAAQLS